MSEGTITGTVTTAVILGSGQYGDQLFVAAGAAIEPSLDGATAITGASDLGSVAIVNYGAVRGMNADPSNGGAGGTGILLQSIGDVVNVGTMSGGRGGYSAGGGVGVDLAAGGMLQNSGNIAGGGFSTRYSPLGGAGVLLGAAASVTNSGTITGGEGLGSSAHQSGEGGAGIEFEGGGKLTNTGQIVAGYDARAAAIFYASAHVTNSGTINGFSAAAGLALLRGGVLSNTGVIGGGVGSDGINGDFAINGRAGLLVDGSAQIFNGGSIYGGGGADVAATQGGSGPGGDGGIGIVLAGFGSICDNAGTLTGGAGGYADFGTSGDGGVGAVVSPGNLLINSGGIVGGAGAANGGLFPGTSSPGGAGGAGAVVLGGEVFNLGVITGGAGGTTGLDEGGAGAAGVIVSSGTLVAAAGTISGGASAAGYAGPTTGAAVVFGNHLAATLVVDPGAVFAGGVEASTSAADTLVLAGTASGTLNAFGESGGIRDFKDISEREGANWTLTGTLTNTENLSMGPHAFLALDGVVGGSSVGFAQSGGDTLCLETPAMFGGVLSALGEGDTIQLADIHATSLAFANGLLSLLGSTGDTLTTLRFADNYPPSDFHLEGIAGGTQINFSLAPY